MKESLSAPERRVPLGQMARIRKMWQAAGHRASSAELVKSMETGSGGALSSTAPGISTYSGADVTMTTSDFLGDWRSADSWQRFDMLRVRARSRQIERSNPWCISFQKSLVSNVLGHAGFRWKPNVLHSVAFGDKGVEGSPDEAANAMLKAFRDRYERAENFTNKKRLHRKEVDALLLTRLCFDGEIIIRKRRKFAHNEFGFTNQIINPDWLDHNLNRIEPNGNITKMGVELHRDERFPVAYWFFRRRPNDFFYNYTQYNADLYERVPAEEVYHIYLQTFDDEQTRGWPWPFAVMVNLFRLGKFEEAAVVNAAVGASKMGFFKKTIPDGFSGSVDELREGDTGEIVDEVAPGSWQELPWNVEPVAIDPKYPADEFGSFEKAMLRGIAACFGCGYVSLTGDLSEANFSNLRAGKTDEQDYWMWLQEFIIRTWKEPEYDDSVYRAILAGKLKLPLSKIDKFNRPIFNGRRWAYVNPTDDLKAKQMELQMGFTSVAIEIERRGDDVDEVFASIKATQEKAEEMGVKLDFGAKPDPAQAPVPGNEEKVKPTSSVK